MGMDVNKAEHVTADTEGNVERIPNRALEAAQTRRQKHTNLVVGGKPKSKKGRTPPKRANHPGRKSKNKKRCDERVNRRERARVNTRYNNQKKDWLFKLMYRLAASGFVLVLEEPTIGRMMKKSNRRMSNETRDLLKMGLSQGIIWAVAKSVHRKHGLPVIDIVAKGTSSSCPTCKQTLWEPTYGTKIWKGWSRVTACTFCLYHIDRDDVAVINIVWRGILYNEPAADSNRRVAGDWGQLVHQLLDHTVMWFPQDGEGQQPKWEVKSLSYMVVEDASSLDDRLNVSNCAAGIKSLEGTPGALC